MSSVIKIRSDNRITLSSDVRRQLGSKAGDRLVIDVQDGMMLLIPVPANYVDALGRHSAIWEKVDSDAYLRQERGSWIS
jgi:AbrB family looped-hinge helix DNA binding protein